MQGSLPAAEHVAVNRPDMAPTRTSLESVLGLPPILTVSLLDKICHKLVIQGSDHRILLLRTTLDLAVHSQILSRQERGAHSLLSVLGSGHSGSRTHSPLPVTALELPLGKTTVCDQ